LVDFELDHRIPLVLGGAPSDPRNLELQPWDEAGEKDHIEACLARAVCAGAIPLDEARRLIWSDWREAGKAFCQWSVCDAPDPFPFQVLKSGTTPASSAYAVASASATPWDRRWAIEAGQGWAKRRADLAPIVTRRVTRKKKESETVFENG
jgi:hypothetical protein